MKSGFMDYASPQRTSPATIRRFFARRKLIKRIGLHPDVNAN
jgi:hypothetical protein